MPLNLKRIRNGNSKKPILKTDDNSVISSSSSGSRKGFDVRTVIGFVIRLAGLGFIYMHFLTSTYNVCVFGGLVLTALVLLYVIKMLVSRKIQSEYCCSLLVQCNTLTRI